MLPHESTDLRSIKRLLFTIARSRYAELFIGFAFARLSRLMPVERILETAKTLVFVHPKPFWQTHWLAVPKQHVPSIVACEAQTLHTLLPSIQTAAAQLVSPVILVNGGAYQDVPQLHFHLTSGADVQGGVWGRERFVGEAPDDLTICPHPHRSRAIHWQIQARTLPAFMEIDWSDRAQAEGAVAALLAARDQAVQLALTAFTIVWNSAEKPFTLHLLAGDTIDAAPNAAVDANAT